MQKLLVVVKAQRVEQAIETHRYLNGATGDGSCALRLSPTAPLPLPDLIFLNADDDIRAWLLANNGRHRLDLMVLESRPDLRQDSTPTSAKKILPHVLHTYLPVWSSNTTSPYPSYPSCIHIMF